MSISPEDREIIPPLQFIVIREFNDDKAVIITFSLLPLIFYVLGLATRVLRVTIFDLGF